MKTKELELRRVAPPTAAAAAMIPLSLLWFLAAGVQEAAAQPRIGAQPKNVAVQLGQDVQFTVTASGVAPLAYQWRLNGTDLGGATNRTLAVSEATLGHLGRYDVQVRNSAGSVTSDPAWLLLATRWTELAVFSASDAMGRCGGPGWTSFLADRLGIPLHNYSEGGADSSGVSAQITDYLSSHAPTTNTLIGLSGGGGVMDLFLGKTVAQAASNHLANVRRLAEAGARSFLILRMWSPDVAPGVVAAFPHFTVELETEYEARLDESLEILKTEYPLTIIRPDLFTFFNAVWETPTAYGFHLPFDPPYTEAYCDGLHLTPAAQLLVNQECYRSITPPVSATLKSGSTTGLLDLEWQGGSPPFRIQRCADFTSGVWQSDEITFLTKATFAPSARHEFYRVVSQGQ
jgi:hypothetical protein